MPKAGVSCFKMIITPTLANNPVMTERGMFLPNSPNLMMPSIIVNTPETMKAANKTSNELLGYFFRVSKAKTMTAMMLYPGPLIAT